MFNPKYKTGATQPWEFYPAAAGTYVVGQLLNLTGGKLTAVSAASKTTPGYLCCGNVTVAEGDVVPVIHIEAGEILVTQLSAEAASAAPGTMLEVSAGGLQVDGAAAGTFEVTFLEGTAAGSTVWGRFH